MSGPITKYKWYRTHHYWGHKGKRTAIKMVFISYSDKCRNWIERYLIKIGAKEDWVNKYRRT